MKRLNFYDRAAEESGGEARMVLTVLEGESLGEKCLLEGEKIWKRKDRGNTGFL